jgi:hypothetical protein
MVRSLNAGTPRFVDKASVDRDRTLTRGKVRAEAAPYLGGL